MMKRKWLLALELAAVAVGVGALWASRSIGDTLTEQMSLRIAVHMAPDDANDPQAIKTFQVLIDGALVPGVFSVDGGERHTEVVEYKDGDDHVTHTRPRTVVVKHIALTKDWSNTSEWYKWRKAVLDGKVDRRSVSVIFHNDAGEEVSRMHLIGALPTDWSGPNQNAKNSGHAVEKLEISWETTELKSS